MNDHGQDITLTWLAAAALGRPRLTFGVPLAAAVVAALISLVVRPMYTSTAAFVPESRSASGISPALLGLASQFGVNVGGQAAQSPQFYAEVLRSRSVETSVLTARFAGTGAPRDSALLLDWLRVPGATPERRIENGLKKLDKLLAVDVDLRTNIVHLAVDAPDPLLARDVAGRFVDLVNDFNLKRRSSQARERRRFVEGRAAWADSALHAAEDRLTGFYEANRLWQSSPTLEVAEARLRREVTLRQDLQSTLAREAETARIEEVNDTPVITVLDAPQVPQRKSRPRRTLIVLATLLAGLLAGTALALLAEVRAQLRREKAPDYEQFQVAAGKLRSSVGAIARQVMRRP